MREMIRRTLRTFIQAAVGYIGADIVYVLTEGKTPEMLKTTLYGLLIAAIAAGIAAVMNMPEIRGSAPAVTVAADTAPAVDEAKAYISPEVTGAPDDSSASVVEVKTESADTVAEAQSDNMNADTDDDENDTTE